MEHHRDSRDLNSSTTSTHKKSSKSFKKAKRRTQTHHQNYGDKPLHLAAMNGDEKAIVDLIATDHSLSDVNSMGEVPLHLAALAGKVELIETFIESGVDVNVPRTDGETPLHLAALKGQDEAIEILIKHGALVDAERYDRETPLHLACLTGQGGAIKKLLDHDANIDARNKRGQTPLHLAALNRHKKAMKMLIKAGADINCIDAKGQTPLDLARTNKELASWIRLRGGQSAYELSLARDDNQEQESNAKDCWVTPAHKCHGRRIPQRAQEVAPNNKIGLHVKKEKEIVQSKKGIGEKTASSVLKKGAEKGKQLSKNKVRQAKRQELTHQQQLPDVQPVKGGSPAPKPTVMPDATLKDAAQHRLPLQTQDETIKPRAQGSSAFARWKKWLGLGVLTAAAGWMAKEAYDRAPMNKAALNDTLESTPSA